MQAWISAWLWPLQLPLSVQFEDDWASGQLRLGVVVALGLIAAQGDLDPHPLRLGEGRGNDPGAHAHKIPIHIDPGSGGFGDHFHRRRGTAGKAQAEQRAKGH